MKILTALLGFCLLTTSALAVSKERMAVLGGDIYVHTMSANGHCPGYHVDRERLWLVLGALSVGKEEITPFLINSNLTATLDRAMADLLDACTTAIERFGPNVSIARNILVAELRLRTSRAQRLPPSIAKVDAWRRCGTSGDNRWHLMLLPLCEPVIAI